MDIATAELNGGYPGASGKYRGHGAGQSSLVSSTETQQNAVAVCDSNVSAIYSVISMAITVALYLIRRIRANT